MALPLTLPAKSTISHGNSQMWICGAFAKMGICGTCRLPLGCVTVHLTWSCTLPSAYSSYLPTRILAWICMAILMFLRRSGKHRRWLLKQYTVGFICLQITSCRHAVSMFICIDLMWKFNIRFDPSVTGRKKGCWKQQGSYKEHLVQIFPCFAANESSWACPSTVLIIPVQTLGKKSSSGDRAESIFMYLIWLATDRGKMDYVPFINWLPSSPVQACSQGSPQFISEFIGYCEAIMLQGSQKVFSFDLGTPPLNVPCKELQTWLFQQGTVHKGLLFTLSWQLLASVLAQKHKETDWNKATW